MYIYYQILCIYLKRMKTLIHYWAIDIRKCSNNNNCTHSLCQIRSKYCCTHVLISKASSYAHAHCIWGHSR